MSGFDEATRDEILYRDRFTCQAHPRGFALTVECAGPLHLHHVILRSQGGPNTVDNGLTICQRHHHYAHDVLRADANTAGIIRSRTVDSMSTDDVESTP